MKETGLTKYLSNLNSISRAADKVKQSRPDEFPLFVSPLYGVTKSIFLQKLFSLNDQTMVLFESEKEASELFVELTILDLKIPVIIINEFTPESVQEKLTQLSSKDKFILLSTFNLLSFKIPDPEQINKSITQIKLGGELNYDELLEYLNLLNYQQDKFVEAPGEFSIRGSIIDFWSYSEKNPVRLEFDGDFIESIRLFEPESQRSIEKIETTTLADKIKNDEENDSDIFDYLIDPLILSSYYSLQNHSFSPQSLFSNVKDVKVDIDKEEKRDNDFPEPTIEEEAESQNDVTIPFEEITRKGRWIFEEEILTHENRIDLGFTEAPAVNSNYEVLFNILKKHTDYSYNVFITVENELQSIRLKDLLSEFKTKLAELIETGIIKIEVLPVKEGFLNKEEKILLLTDYQIFNKPYRTKISTSKKLKKARSKNLASIKKGDYVVHEDYGIGKYVGLQIIKIGSVQQESMKLLFADNGVVYVNLNYLGLVKKYSSNKSAEKGLLPTLSTLGTGEWERTKSKTKKKIKEAARELIELYAKRKASKGFQFSDDTVWQKELEASFFYEDTPDQARATEEVKSDMEEENPMDRLVCGDVGFGKTEVAVRAAFKAVQDGKQAAVLVPTTILAEQHYNTFRDRLTQFPVTVAALSRFQTKKEQTEIVKGLTDGTVDIVIGTHRLLSKDIKFKDLGLLIIDEEHRFGVKSKEKLRSFKVNVDTLTLTATPIPRTLNLSLLGARDLSIISTPPPNRQPIYTSVSTFDILKIKEWIMSELRRGGQVYFVHDRVQSIDKLADYLSKYLPDVQIGVAHGQMKPAQLENVIHKFLNREFDILLSTKIIESGIDIPNVNTIIVNRADRFGLAELHQLRGRVGRSNRQAHAHFIVPSMSGITKKALRRLQAIEEFTDIGAGFNISMRDLEIRGAGNLLGTEQTGFINDVGFDLYIKMINEAVEELKYQEFREVFDTLPKGEKRTDPTVDTFFEIGIPEDYMPEQMDRLNFYTALYSVRSMNGIKELKDEMQDRFGNIPEIVHRLILTATVKFVASYALLERVVFTRKNIILVLPSGQDEDFYNNEFKKLIPYISSKRKDEIQFNQQKEKMKLVIINNFEEQTAALKYAISLCSDIASLYENEVKTFKDDESAAA